MMLLSRGARLLSRRSVAPHSTAIQACALRASSPASVLSIISAALSPSTISSPSTMMSSSSSTSIRAFSSHRNHVDVLSKLSELLVTGEVEVVDCTAVLGPGTPLLKLPPDFAKNTPPIKIHSISEYDNNGPFWAWNWLELGEHSGTHFDAPHHWITGRDYADGYTDTLPVQRLVAPVNVLDFAKECNENSDFLLTLDHIKAWEDIHGTIKAGEWVVMRSDWDKRSHDQDLFINANETGPHSPGPTAETIEYLLTKDIVGWGSQCIGTDAGQAGGMIPPYPAHNLLHKHNRFGLASLVNLDKLPPKGAILIAAPLKIENGTGSPIRALALVPKG